MHGYHWPSASGIEGLLEIIQQSIQAFGSLILNGICQLSQQVSVENLRQKPDWISYSKLFPSSWTHIAFSKILETAEKTLTGR